MAKNKTARSVNRKAEREAKRAAKKAPQTTPVVKTAVTKTTPVGLDELAEVVDVVEELAEVTSESTSTDPTGIVLDSHMNGDKVQFTRILTTNPDNGKQLTVIDYKPDVLRQPLTKVTFKFGRHQNKYTAYDVETIGMREDLEVFQTTLSKAPRIDGLYMSHVLTQIINSKDPEAEFEALGVVGVSTANDLVYVIRT